MLALDFRPHLCLFRPWFTSRRRRKRPLWAFAHRHGHLRPGRWRGWRKGIQVETYRLLAEGCSPLKSSIFEKLSGLLCFALGARKFTCSMLISLLLCRCFAQPTLFAQGCTPLSFVGHLNGSHCPLTKNHATACLLRSSLPWPLSSLKRCLRAKECNTGDPQW